MPSITIEIRDMHIATIGLRGVQLADVSVHGALDTESKATLRAMGGDYREGGCGHLIWIEERALSYGDVVRVRLDEADEIGDRGRTIEELYPDEEPSMRTDFTISEEMAAQLRARPRLHAAFIAQAETSSGGYAKAASDERNTSFTFGVVWDSFHPNQARVRLTTRCLDDVLARTGGHDHLRTTLSVGESAAFSLLE